MQLHSGCARKDKVAGQLAFTKTGIGRYIVTKEDDLLFVYDTRVGANDGADGKEKVLTAFFRAPSPITIVSCAGDKIAVCCQNFAVLTLQAWGPSIATGASSKQLARWQLQMLGQNSQALGADPRPSRTRA